MRIIVDEYPLQIGECPFAKYEPDPIHLHVDGDCFCKLDNNLCGKSLEKFGKQKCSWLKSYSEVKRRYEVQNTI